MKLQWFCQNIYANSGYSDEARVFIDGLRELGVDVTLIGKDKKPAAGTYRFAGKTDPRVPVVYHTYRHSTYEPGSHPYSIARTMLEVSRIPLAWVHRLNRLNEVWVPGDFNFHSFLQSGVGRERLFIVPGPLDLSPAAEPAAFTVKTKKRFKFLSLFNYDVRHRKGLDVLLAAFCRAFTASQDVCLVIKTRANLRELEREYRLAPDHPEIVAIDAVLERRKLLALYRAVDCLVLPTRGEGVGRPFLDAMMMGVPIITTGWGGQRDFLNEGNAFLIDYRLKDVEERFYLKYPGFYGAKWAEPDRGDLIRKMRQIFKNPATAGPKIAQARKDVERFDKQHIAHIILERLARPVDKTNLLPSPPALTERLYPLYYPGLTSMDEVAHRNRQAFLKPVRSLALVGKGQALRRAVHFLQPGVKIEMGIPRPRQPVDMLVMAETLKDVEPTFYEVREKIDSLPIYLFA